MSTQNKVENVALAESVRKVVEEVMAEEMRGLREITGVASAERASTSQGSQHQEFPLDRPLCNYMTPIRRPPAYEESSSDEDEMVDEDTLESGDEQNVGTQARDGITQGSTTSNALGFDQTLEVDASNEMDPGFNASHTVAARPCGPFHTPGLELMHGQMDQEDSIMRDASAATSSAPTSSAPPSSAHPSSALPSSTPSSSTLSSSAPPSSISLSSTPSSSRRPQATTY